MNKQITIAKYAQKVLDASLRRALGKRGMEMVKSKQAKLIYLDGEWWLLDMIKEPKRSTSYIASEKLNEGDLVVYDPITKTVRQAIQRKDGEPK